MIYVHTLFLGVNNQFTVSIINNPRGAPFSGSNNTFEYRILTSLILTCNVTSNDNSSFTVTSYQWNTEGCYTNPNFNNGNPRCFPHGQSTQNVSDSILTAEDAGNISCTVTISGNSYTSDPITLRITGNLYNNGICDRICQKPSLMTQYRVNDFNTTR